MPAIEMRERVSSVDLAARFKALGDPTRLRILEFLLECRGDVAIEESGDVRPADGPTVGEVCCRVTGIDRITSTLSHHLKELRLAGLIEMEKRGRHLICSVNHEAVQELAEWLRRPKGCC